MKKLIAILVCLLSLGAEAREVHNFDRGWLFKLADSGMMGQGNEAQIAAADYTDSNWRRLNLPHDWAIEGDFSIDNPSGTGGGALPGGIGWYRKHFSLPSHTEGERYFIDFDGVYMNSHVYLNGHLLGHRPYGYSSFEYDMTPYLNVKGDNVLAVKVDNSDQPNSRWYSGCGIYRHVWMVRTSDIRIAHWGTCVTASEVSENHAELSINTELVTNKSAVKVSVRTCLSDARGKVLGGAVGTVTVAPTLSGTSLKQQISLSRPHLWSIANPYIYQVRTEVYVGKRMVDAVTTPIGIRTIRFDAVKGFYLNGENLKINGVCDHHDLGCLGAALNNDALHRQLRILKDMGVNAIRCSHNPPAPELLNMCDTMGFVVMDEAYDIWRKKKTAHDYAQYFQEWHARDMSDMVKRDRNHPSIVLWSIGNEVLEQWSDAKADTLTLEEANMILNFGHDKSQLAKEGEMSVNSLLAQKLAGIVKSLDVTRPVTAGCNEPSPDNHLFRSEALDVIGYNYHNQNIPDVPKNFPDRPFIISESVSALMSRGYYQMPSDSIVLCPKRWDIPYTNPTFKCSSYDNCHAPWGSTHEETWDIVKHTPFVSGQFIWTGFDYLGEPTPYGWPARSSYFGIVDLAGFPKDIYYMYQSEWTNKPVLHLFPHWNWTPGQTIDLWAYYNQADAVQLFINGKSQGMRRKGEHDYHVMWRVEYQPGEAKVVAYDKAGKMLRETSIRTAGEPYQIRLTPDKTVLKADGTSLSFVTVEVVDKQGVLCPNAENDIHFDVTGEATIAGVDNGSQTSLERFKARHRKAFYGKCLVVLQSTDKRGLISLSATSTNLQPSAVRLSAE